MPTKMSAAAGTLLRSRFGFERFRPGQEEAIESLAAGRHTLVVMPTGAGKSLIYQVAALQSDSVTLVVSPLISLMRDQVGSLTRRKIAATFINSSVASEEQTRRLSEMAEGQYSLVYVAPERLRSVAFRKALARVRVGLLAVDEAHCISEWGHDFRPDYLRIAEARRELGSPVTAALTATATVRVQEEITRLLGLENAARIVTGFNRPNLSLHVRYAADAVSKLRALRATLSEEGGTPAIVYCGTRRDSEEVATFASEVLGIQALAYHAGLEAAARDAIQESFMAGDCPVVAATSAFGMGIDRQDVRMVVHFSVPGTLEAYYQEAGRAGRDGDPATAVLIYAPQDRALQEFFIENDSIAAGDLGALYSALESCVDGETWVRAEDLSLSTGFGETKLRLALAALEKAGMIRRMGDEGTQMLIALERWDEAAAESAEADADDRRAFRHAQLGLMIGYAESEGCRRQIILSHFGDPGPCEAPDCCDNCHAHANAPPADATLREFKDLPVSEKTALVILDAVRRLRWGIGMQKLAQLLHGSSAETMRTAGYDRSPYYGRLAAFRRAEVVDMVRQLVDLRYLKSSGDADRPVLTLTALAQEAIRLRAPVPLRMPYAPDARTALNKQKARQAGGTAALTQQMFRDGMAPEAIASERNLGLDTIYTHLARLIGQGGLVLGDVIDSDVASQVRAAIERVGSAAAVASIKRLLPDAVGYGQIRCVAEAWRRDHPEDAGAASAREAILECVRAHPGELPRSRIADLLSGYNPERLGEMVAGPFYRKLPGLRTNEVVPIIDSLLQEGRLFLDDRRKVWPAVAAAPPRDLTCDEVEQFLSRSHPQKLRGPWECGWALGFHSGFAGSEWSRSPAGELAYRLKYRQDTSALEDLVCEAIRLLEAHPELSRADAIVPAPPTAHRDFDHVDAFAREFATRLGLDVLDALTKARSTAPQKAFRTLAQKKHNVSGAYAADRSVAGRRILVVDDLYDSGATLEEITLCLRRAGAAAVLVLTMTRTIHSDD